MANANMAPSPSSKKNKSPKGQKHAHVSANGSPAFKGSGAAGAGTATGTPQRVESPELAVAGAGMFHANSLQSLASDSSQMRLTAYSMSELATHTEHTEHKTPKKDTTTTPEEDAAIEISQWQTVGVMDPKKSGAAWRPLTNENVEKDDFPKGITEFSDISNPDRVKQLCLQRIPGWSALQPADLTVNQLCEGLSNQLFKVSIPSVSAANDPEKNIADTCVLFRVYGSNAAKFYDPAEELKHFKLLSSYRIAPRLIAHGEGWRVEEWHASVAVPVKLLVNPSIFSQVASQLGRFHKLHCRPDFPKNINTENLTLKRLRDWGREACKINFTDEANRKKLIDLDVPRFAAEALELAERLKSCRGITGCGFDEVFAHNDCQENNLLQTQYGIRLIDFEYSGFNYAAFDIANFFCEYMMDYCHTRYPFYTVCWRDFPDENVQRMFVAVYLSEYLETPIFPTDAHIIDPMLESIKIMCQVSHILWGLWSVTRAPQGATYDEFDFLAYAKVRLEMYSRAKAEEEAQDGVPATIIRAIPRKRDICLTTALGALVGGTVAAYMVMRMNRK